MSYYDSAEGKTISRDRAAKECADHGAFFSDLVEDLGEHAEYDAQEVLRWLGY